MPGTTTDAGMMAAVIRKVYLSSTGAPLKAMEAVALLVEARVKTLLSTPGTGAVYRHGNVEHRASAPGDPPAVDTGRYRASWSHRVGSDAQGAYAEIGTADERGPWFEFGTTNMAPRPHARRAVDETLPALGRAIQATIVSELRRAVR